MGDVNIGDMGGVGVHMGVWGYEAMGVYMGDVGDIWDIWGCGAIGLP